MTSAESLTTLRADLLGWISAALFIGVGAAALLLFTRHSGRRPWALLYFSVFMGIYGARLIVDTESGGVALGLPNLRADQIVSALSYLIPIPAILYVRELVDGRARRFLGWLARASGVLALAFMASDLIRGVDGSGAAAGNALALLFLGPVIVGLFRRWSDLKTSLGDRSSAVLAFGTIAFVLFAINQNLSELGVLPWKQNVEHVGLLIFTLSVGYVTVARVSATQATLTAMEQELSTARRIQTELLPKRAPDIQGFTFAARFVPMTAVAGDFYDYVRTESGFAVLIADAAGHGVSAALLASMVKVASAASRRDAAHPSRALTRLNQVLCDAGAPGFATAAWLHVEAASGAGRYCAAGHPPLMVHRRALRSVEEVTENGLLLGAFSEAAYADANLILGVGDRALMYTDGLIEANDEHGEEFGTERLALLFAETSGLDLESQAQAILTRLSSWRGTATQNDDITLVLAERSEAD
jgi:sigma-B regulation protein RsbU (phosphoserine phosphatase)